MEDQRERRNRTPLHPQAKHCSGISIPHFTRPPNLSEAGSIDSDSRRGASMPHEARTLTWEPIALVFWRQSLLAEGLRQWVFFYGGGGGGGINV